jgi:hypothetical protein
MSELGELANPERGVGTVEVLRPGFLKGYLDRLAPKDQASEVSFDAWLGVCRNAEVVTSRGVGSD